MKRLSGICEVCWNTAWTPCTKDHPDSIPDGGSGWMYCEHCRLNKLYLEQSLVLVTLCDLVFDVNAEDRSDAALIRAVERLVRH